MPFKNISEFIQELKAQGELIQVTEQVDSMLEITEITDRVSKKFGPAILFENVKNSKMPVLINAFGSEKRMNIALGIGHITELADRIEAIVEQEQPTSFLDKIKSVPKLIDLASIFPTYVKTAPCKEVILKGDDVDLGLMPVLQCWPQDAGRFITLPCVFTKDPESGMRNCGMYRMQVYDKNTTGMHWHPHHGGADHFRKAKLAGKDKLEVAVVIGADPVITYSATAPVPDGFDEMMFAGFIRKKGVELVKCETVDLEVPASAEIVLEGYVNVDELRLEGPFGDHTGYYSLADFFPVFHVTCMTMRKNPIYNATIVGKPPMEDTFMGVATGRIFLPLLKKQMPEIVDLAMPIEGVFHNMVFISIKKRYPHHARKIMNFVWGAGQMMFTKMVVIVDDDVNVHNTSEVLWRLGNNVDWEHDAVIMKGPVDALDHAARTPNFGGKVGIDATVKWESEGHTRGWPDTIEMSEDVKKIVDEKWKRLGL